MKEDELVRQITADSDVNSRRSKTVIEGVAKNTKATKQIADASFTAYAINRNSDWLGKCTMFRINCQYE